MGDIVTQRDLSALIDLKAMSKPLSWTAGGGSDSATFTGISIDRGGFSGGQLMPGNMDFDVFYSATLASGATLSLQLEIDSAPDNSTWTAFATEGSAVVATGPSGGGAVTGVYRMAALGSNAPSGAPGVNLLAAQRYIRSLVIPHLSSTGTDTAVIACVGVYAGFDRLAAPTT